jgi:hypothetical protein
VLLGEGDHLAESGTPGRLGGLDIDKLLGSRQTTAGSVRSQQIELRRNGEALAFLVLRGDASVQNGSVAWFEDSL